MNNFIKQVIDETFRSKRQQRYFYAKAGDETSSEYKRDKWKKMADEFSSKTDFDKLPEKAEEQEKEVDEMTTEFQEIPTNVCEKKEKIQKPSSHDKGNTKVYPKRPTPWSKSVKKPKEKEVEEIVDADGNIATGDMPGNPNGFIRSKRTSDEVAKTTMGMMGSFGVLGGNTSGNKTLKYWAESDMSKALGAKDTIMDPKVDNYEDAEEYFEDELDIPEDEAKDRVEKLGYDKELPDGKIRLIENPKKYIEEYLAKKAKPREFVKKSELEYPKKNINPILLKQLASIKQSLKNNGLTSKDITEYLEDYNE
jgi:hypothetical protein